AMSGRSLGFLAEPLAQIEPSTGVSQSAVLEALEKIRARHVAKLAPADRRHFLAAYHLERAAAMSRSGSRAGAIADLLQSWMHAPLRHRALAAVIHNCFAAARRI
uniref:hypothetical protein n=1 Tax=Tardiphaga sp. TaxID=1926292 RepID=UPI0025E396A0